MSKWIAIWYDGSVRRATLVEVPPLKNLFGITLAELNEAAGGRFGDFDHPDADLDALIEVKSEEPPDVIIENNLSDLSGGWV